MKKRILIVEDDAPLARILADNLTFEGFDVRRVADGDAADRRGLDLRAGPGRARHQPARP